MADKLNRSSNTVFGFYFLAHCRRSLLYLLVRCYLLYGRCQIMHGQFFLRDRIWAHAQSCHTTAPKWLIAEEGADHSWFSGPQTGGCRSRAAVMDNGRYPSKEPVVRGGFDPENRRR